MQISWSSPWLYCSSGVFTRFLIGVKCIMPWRDHFVRRREGQSFVYCTTLVKKDFAFLRLYLTTSSFCISNLDSSPNYQTIENPFCSESYFSAFYVRTLRWYHFLRQLHRPISPLVFGLIFSADYNVFSRYLWFFRSEMCSISECCHLMRFDSLAWF